jgi:hypothetical protein
MVPFLLTAVCLLASCKSFHGAKSRVQQGQSAGALHYDKSSLSSHQYRLVLFRPAIVDFDPAVAFLKQGSGQYSVAGSGLNLGTKEEMDYLMTHMMGQFQGYFAEISSRNDHLLEQFHKSLLAARLAGSKVLTPALIKALQGQTYRAAILPREQSYLHYFSNSALTQSDGGDQQAHLVFRPEDPKFVYESTLNFVEQSAKRNAERDVANKRPYLVGVFFALRAEGTQILLDVRLMAGLPPMEVPVNIVQKGVAIKNLVVPTEKKPNDQPLAYLDASVPLLDGQSESYTWDEVLADTKVTLFFGNLGSYNPLDHMFSPKRPFLNSAKSVPFANVEKEGLGPFNNLKLALGVFHLDPSKGKISGLSGHVTPMLMGRSIWFPINLDHLPWLDRIPGMQIGDVKGEIKDELNQYIQDQADKEKLMRLLMSEILKSTEA